MVRVACVGSGLHQESGTKLAVAAFEKMCNRHIWMEDAARHERGVTHEITPPSIICWDFVLICGVLFALAVYVLSAWLFDNPPPAVLPLACSWSWKKLRCLQGCKMLLPGICKLV